MSVSIKVQVAYKTACKNPKGYNNGQFTQLKSFILKANSMLRNILYKCDYLVLFLIFFFFAKGFGVSYILGPAVVQQPVLNSTNKSCDITVPERSTIR